MPARAEVEIYTLPTCYACGRARRLLQRRGIPFEEISVLDLPAGRRTLAELTGRTTVPQILVRGEPVGGSDSLALLDRAGVLEPLVRGDEFPVVVVRRRLSPLRLLTWLPSTLGGGGCGPWRYVVELVDRDGRRLERVSAASAGDAEALATSLKPSG